MERKNAREKALQSMKNKEEERKQADAALVGAVYEDVMEEATTETTAVSTGMTMIMTLQLRNSRARGGQLCMLPWMLTKMRPIQRFCHSVIVFYVCLLVK